MKAAILITVVLILSAPLAQAQHDTVGNGGDTILIDGKYCMLDLAEAGVCNTVDAAMKVTLDSFNNMQSSGLAPSESYLKRFYKLNFSDLHDLPFDTPILKGLVSLLEHMPKANVMLLEAAIMSFEWKRSNTALINIGDEETFVDTTKFPLHQVAVRHGNKIQIDDTIFTQMSLANQLALIFHEALYSLVTPVQKTKTLFVQQSKTARDLNGRWFDQLVRGVNDNKWWGWSLESIPNQQSIQSGAFFYPYVYFGAHGFRVVKASRDFAEVTRIYFPQSIGIYNSTSIRESKNVEVPKNRVDGFHTSVKNDIIFPSRKTYGGRAAYFLKESIPNACSKLIKRRAKEGTIALEYSSFDTKFTKVKGSNNYALDFTKPTEWKTNANSAYSYFGVYSIKFEVSSNQNLCIENAYSAYLQLRRTALKYFEGDSGLEQE